MKKESSAASRQNDKEAINLNRASYRCLRNERLIKYIMIFLSFGICLAAIFNRYLPQLLPYAQNVEELQATAATYINLISGGILVASIPLGFYCTRMHTEGTVLQDRYEAYVFDNPSNKSILRPISDAYVSEYSRKAHRPNSEFKNGVYPDCAPSDESTAQYEYISKEARADYKLYLYIQPFFVTIWVGFCILIIIIAVSFNDMFVTTLINIMIPSLSAITTIGTSWYNCRLQMRQLTNLINVVDRIESLPQDEHRAYITDKENVRLLADGLFNYRSSAFVIPNFLIKMHKKSLLKSAAPAEKAPAAPEAAAVSEPAPTHEKKHEEAKPVTAKTEVKHSAAKAEAKHVAAKTETGKKQIKPASAKKTETQARHSSNAAHHTSNAAHHSSNAAHTTQHVSATAKREAAASTPLKWSGHAERKPHKK